MAGWIPNSPPPPPWGWDIFGALSFLKIWGVGSAPSPPPLPLWLGRTHPPTQEPLRFLLHLCCAEGASRMKQLEEEMTMKIDKNPLSGLWAGV